MGCPRCLFSGKLPQGVCPQCGYQIPQQNVPSIFSSYQQTLSSRALVHTYNYHQVICCMQDATAC